MKTELSSSIRLFGSVLLLAALFCGLSGTTVPRVTEVQEAEGARQAPAIAQGVALLETFSMAPTEWRTAGAAIADVHNRWPCDPRWTFFGLQSGEVGKPAVLWSKRLFPGDVSVEFYFCTSTIRTARGGAGRGMDLVRDINVTIGSDGTDLRKGCTFSYCGHNNTCSFIARDGTDLQREPMRFDMAYFNHWFRFRAERHAGKLQFKVDKFLTGPNGEAEWIVDDARPMDGDRVAIWTQNCAIMISRVWISGEGGGVESPDFLAGAVRTIYDE